MPADVACPLSPVLPCAPVPAKSEIIPEVSTLKILLLLLGMYKIPVASVQIPVGVGTPAEVAGPPSPENEVRLDPKRRKQQSQTKDEGERSTNQQ
jgi:hypothetical protein